MKLLYRLFVTLIILMSILAAIYFSLPAALESFARHQLTHQGFSDVELKIDSIGLESSVLSSIQFSNEDISVHLQDVQLDYQLTALLNGELDSIQLDEMTLSLKPGSGEPGQATLPDPEILFAILGAPLAEMFPLSSLLLTNLRILAADGSLILSASGEILKQKGSLQGEFLIHDSRSESYQLQLNTSPQTGLNVALLASEKEASSGTLFLVNLNQGEQAGELRGRARLDLDGMSTLLSIAPLFSGELKADIRYSTAQSRSMHPFSLGLQGQSLKLGTWQLDEINVRVSGQIEMPDLQLNASFEEGSEILLRGLAQGDARVGELRLRLPQTASITQDGSYISISKDAEVTLHALQLETLSIPKARLSQIAFERIPNAKRVASAESCTFAAIVSMPLLDMGESQLEFDDAQLEGQCLAPDFSLWQVTAMAPMLAYDDADLRIALSECELGLGNSVNGRPLDSDPAELGGQIHCVSSPVGGVVSAAVRLNALNGVGRAEYSISGIQPDDTRPLLASLFKDWQQPFDIVSGEISLQGVYRWWKTGSGGHREKLEADIAVHDAGGHYSEILFSGLEYQASVDLLPRLESQGSSLLSVSDIDIGLPVTNASAMIGFSESASGPLPLLKIEQLALSVLRSRISADGSLFDMNLDDHSIGLNVEGMDLQQIVAIQQVEGLSASGTLDGYVPLTMSAGGLRIESGKVNARKPGGYIQYVPQNGVDISSAAQSTELLMQILEDLEYNSLEVDVNYAENGEMDMQLAIKGISPGLDTTRPVHFNMNLQQNLLTLLQGLRYVNGINENIDQSVQEYFNEQKTRGLEN